MKDQARFGLKAVGSALGSIATENIAKFPGRVDLEYLKSTVGILQTFHKQDHETAIDLSEQAVHDLQKTCAISPADIDLLVVVSQHTRPNIPPLSASLSGRLGLKDSTYCLDLSIGCTGFVQGAHVVTSLMKGDDRKQALLINVETLSEVLSPEDMNTNFIFSDAATATLFTREDFMASFTAFDFATAGSQCLALHAENSRLTMDGLAIYNFVTRQVPGALRKLVGSHGLNVQDLNAIFFHQASYRTVAKVRESFQSQINRIPYDILEYGNTGSCTIPLLLKSHLPNMVNDPQRDFLLSSFGSGLSFANALMRMA